MYVVNFISTKQMTCRWHLHGNFKEISYFNYHNSLPFSAIELVGVVDNKIVNLYDPLTLTCNSTGSRGPPDAIDWFFEGNLVSNRDPHWKGRIMITKRIQERNPYSLLSDLVISRTEMGDQGRYICRSTTYTDPTTVMPTISAEVMILNSECPSP